MYFGPSSGDRSHSEQPARPGESRLLPETNKQQLNYLWQNHFDSTKQRKFEVVQIKGNTSQNGDKERSRKTNRLRPIPQEASSFRATSTLAL